MKEKLNDFMGFRTTKSQRDWLEGQAALVEHSAAWVINKLVAAAKESGQPLETYLSNADLRITRIADLEREVAALRAALAGTKLATPNVGTGPPVVNDEGAKEGHGREGTG